MNISKIILPVAKALLIFINIWTLLEFSTEVSDYMRFGNMLIYFLLLLFFNEYSKKHLILFLLLLICDGFLIFYKIPIFNLLTFIMRIAIYLLLFSLVAKKLKGLRLEFTQVAVFGVVLVVNIFLLLALVEMVPSEYDYDAFNTLFYIYGVASILVVAAAISYSNRYENKISLYYIAAVLGLIFSDLTYFIAFYLEFEEFYIPERIFNILAIAFLVQYAISATRRDSNKSTLYP
ncbi:hypothetical protein [Gillisia sp. Hel_I_29]|uniref:hypothetical protein n=1 Tax=Gillisia sp. Hel_I_29 TaxID=1249975 RepID=UPI0005579851|nr:hypothetical protein [Gillisia sp. Hel_I_29]